jgi:RimJ/RimL family protein N-acetyltransferase
MIPRKLKARDVLQIVMHLTSLKAEDRRLRFGGMVSDDYIIEYIENSFLEGNSQWFGIDHIDGHLVAACHASILDGQAELGCSVDPDYRSQGFAQLMFDRAVTWLRTQGIQEVYMHCLSENGAMKHIARKNDMTVVSEYGESDANVEVKPATPFTVMEDAYLDRIAMYDMAFKQQMKVFRSMYA